jgi:hypothetical protein
MDNPSTYPSKSELLADIRAARAELEALIAPLSPQALSRPGPDGGWSIQDHLIHLAEWRWKLLAMINGRSGNEGLHIDEQVYHSGDFDAINDLLYRRNRARSTEDLLTEFRRAHAEVIRAIEQLPEVGLLRAYDLTLPGDTRPLVAGILGNTSDHDREHIEWIKEMLKPQK